MKVSEASVGDVLVVRLEGRMDAAAAPLLERKINECIEAGTNQLVVNCKQVEYLSSAGLRWLLVVSKKLKSLHGKLVLASVGDEVDQVIRMSGFDQVLDIAASEAQALERF